MGYLHTGSIVANTDAPEFAFRAKSGKSVTAVLRRRVLREPALPRKARVQAATQSVHSRILFQSGTWNPMTESQLRSVRGALVEPSRSVVKAENLNGLERVSDAVVLSQLRQPEIEAVLVAQKLRCLSRMLGAPTEVRATIQSPGGDRWRTEACKCLRVLQLVLPGKVGGLADPRVAVGEWERLIVDHAPSWKFLVRRCLAVVGENGGAWSIAR